MESLQSSPLPESAEILDILNRIEFEGLFFSHDKLAERQVRFLANLATLQQTHSNLNRFIQHLIDPKVKSKRARKMLMKLTPS